MKLTNNEIKILNGMRTNVFSDILIGDSGDWAFAVIDASGLKPEVARGVISSLIKKDLVKIKKDVPNNLIDLTKRGRAFLKGLSEEDLEYSGEFGIYLMREH